MIDVVGYSVEDNSDIEESTINAAKKHYKDGNYDMAIRLYLGLLNTGASSRLYLDIGLCYYKLNKLDTAIDYLTRATTLDTRNSVAYSYLGNCYFKKLDANSAIENWILARSISPKDEFVCLNLAIAYFAKNMTYESVFFYDKYLKYAQNKDTSQYMSIQKNLNEAFRAGNDYFIEAQHNHTRGDISLAEKNYSIAVKKYPIISEYTTALGDLYYNAKNYIKAVQYFDLAVRENSNKNKDVYKKMAICYHNLNDYRMAYCFYNRYIKFTINSQQEYLEIMKNIQSLKRQLDLSSAQVTLELAKRHYSNNEYFESLIEYENYTILNPEAKNEYLHEINKLKSFTNPEGIITHDYLERGDKLLKQGEIKGANKYFTEVMQLSNPKSDEYKLAKSKISNV